MTEAEWLVCSRVFTFLDFLQRHGASERKLRLFAVACCHRLAPRHFVSATSLDAIRVAEQFAEGLATQAELRSAASVMEEAWETARLPDTFGPNQDELIVLRAIADCVRPRSGLIAAQLTANAAASANVVDRQVESEERAQVELIRDIFGNPFRPVVFDLAWRTEAVVALAAGIYADRAFDRLPVLADALEDAGCADADLLAHCRGPGPHVRGCWAVDLVLGKT